MISSVGVTTDGMPFEEADYPEEPPHWLQGGIVMQSTGLHDKNGKEIFEGDIVEYLGSRGKVIWNDEGAWLVDWLSHNGRSGVWELRGKYEVIGNRFEHPDLLPSA